MTKRRCFNKYKLPVKGTKLEKVKNDEAKQRNVHI